MSILNRGAVPSTPLVCLGSCLLITMAGFSAFPTRSGAVDFDCLRQIEVQRFYAAALGFKGFRSSSID